MVRLKALDDKGASPLCFGCMQFGSTADAIASRAMFNACRDAGINFLDTAHTYTGGWSGELPGGFIRGGRDTLIIATKTGYTGGSGRESILA
ncbi:MAG: aldo/keto reductase [Pseudomonadota bacterium]